MCLKNHLYRDIITLPLLQPRWEEKVAKADTLNSRESLKVKVFLDNGNQPACQGTGTQTPLAFAGQALMSVIQMSFLLESHPMRWHHWPTLAAAEPLLWLLCQSVITMQLFNSKHAFAQSRLQWLWGHAQTLWRILFSQNRGGFWLEHGSVRVGAYLLRALLHVPAVKPTAFCYQDMSYCLQHFPPHSLYSQTKLYATACWIQFCA